MEDRAFRGWWWLPGRSAEDLPGTLVVTKGEGVLELTNHFGHEILEETATEIRASGRLTEQPRILGVGSRGELITTVGHLGASYEAHSTGVTLSKYKRGVTLVGRHYESAEAIEFDEISLRTSDLAAWTQVRAIETKAKQRRHTNGYHVWSEVSARFRPLEDIDIPLGRGERAFIRFGCHFDGIDALGRGSEHVEFAQDTELHLRFAKSKPLEDVFDRVGELRNFLSFAVARPVAVLSVTGYRDVLLNERTREPVPIEILWGVPHNPAPPGKPREPREMLFTLPAVEGELSKVMRSWLAKQRRLEPVFNIFFGLLYLPDIYSDVQFLLLAQAVETYGYLRRRVPIARSFREQIREVLATCPSVSRKIVGADADAFTALLKVTRDYYTHYNPAKKERAAKDVGVLLLSTQLKSLLEMAFLRELGFGHRAIDEILARARRYQEIEHLKAYASAGA